MTPTSIVLPSRQSGLDALRAFLTLLVVFHHTAITYGAPGGWFYIERAPDASSASALLTAFVAVNQAFFMGLFFLLAGYFTTPALASKGPSAFVRGRLLRLGLPLLVFGLVLGPLTVALAGTARGRPFAETLLNLWQRGIFIPGPLWFAEALLIFSGFAVVWFVTLRHAVSADAIARTPFSSHVALAAWALVTGLAAWGLRFTWPVGTEVAGLQLGYFASYVVLFAAGCSPTGQRWIVAIPAANARIWRRVALIAMPVLPLSIKIASSFPALDGSFAGDFSVPAIVYALWEPFIAWGLIMALLVAFVRRGSPLGSVWRRLGAFT